MNLDDLCNYVIWMSIELNVVIIVASIPFLRPLFGKQGGQGQLHPARRWQNSTLGSVLSGKGTRTTLSRIDSEENIIEARSNAYPMERQGQGLEVTREVTVTYESSNLPFVHASLVGLIQGEIENPRLVRR